MQKSQRARIQAETIIPVEKFGEEHINIRKNKLIPSTWAHRKADIQSIQAWHFPTCINEMLYYLLVKADYENGNPLFPRLNALL